MRFFIGLLFHAVSCFQQQQQFLSLAPQDAPAGALGDDKMEKLGPVMEKLRHLDSKTYGLLSNLLKAVETHKTSLIQDPQDNTEAKMEALEPILEKLQKLDPASFANLNSAIKKAEKDEPKENRSLKAFLQEPKEKTPEEDVNVKLLKLQPILEKLRHLDNKAFGAINNLVDQATSLKN